MPLKMASSPPRASRLALYDNMAAIAILAFSFALLPGDLAVLFAITVAVTMSGILAVQWLRLPLITEGPGVRKWLPWVLWFLMLAACPVATLVIGVVFPYTGPPPFARVRPWAANLVEPLYYAHVGVSIVASIAVVLLTRGGYRWIAWVVILAIGGLAALVALGAIMATTGEFL